MGIELDVLVGHPQHELMFIANQVAHAAGLKDAAHKARNVAKTLKGYRASDHLGVISPVCARKACPLQSGTRSGSSRSRRYTQCSSGATPSNPALSVSGEPGPRKP